MATTPESQLKYKIKEFFKTKKPDIWYDSPVRNGYGRSGPPDIHGCFLGFFFTVETKSPGKKTSAWQDAEIYDIQMAKGFHITCDSWEQFYQPWAEFEAKVRALFP